MINYNQPQQKHKYVSSYDEAITRAANAGGGVPFASANGGGTRGAEVEDVLMANPLEGWDSRTVRGALKEEWARFVSGLADWKSFITLTFEQEKYPDVAKSLFKWWVKLNNEYVFGKHYTKKVGHSYFSYLVGMEYQKREVVHFHVLVDKPIKYELTHNAWGDRCGFAWIDGNLKDQDKVINYVCKYVLKGGEVDLYRASKDFSPNPKPTWWKEDEKTTLSSLQPVLAPAH